MFSRNIVVLLVILALIVINILALSISSLRHEAALDSGQMGMTIISPFQKMVISATQSIRDVWRQYFWIISTIQENESLKTRLNQAINDLNRRKELELSNIRFRKLLDFKTQLPYRTVACEVIGKDPSPWFKTLIVDKGQINGIQKGLGVMAPEGVVGQVIDVTDNFSKILLIIDPNSAVDALVQETRSRGIVKGDSLGMCQFRYVSRKDDISVNDSVISSGLDGVFLKGFPIGRVREVVRNHSGIFQDIVITPHVDFEKLEEVLVVLDRPEHDLSKEP